MTHAGKVARACDGTPADSREQEIQEILFVGFALAGMP